MPQYPQSLSPLRSRTPCPPVQRDVLTPCLLERAQLHAVPSTLLIPLVARAHGGRYFPWLDCRDAVAADLLERLGADGSVILRDLPTMLQVLWRTRAIKEAGRAFFAAHPGALGVNLGCGLTQHFQWFDTGTNHWLDADLPEVMALRQQLLSVRGPRTRHAEVDIAEPGWWQRLGLPQARAMNDGDGEGLDDGGVGGVGGGASTALPVLIVCEGVLMYLQPAQVHAVLDEFAHCAPMGSRMVLDVLTRRAVGHAARHASVGPTGAQFLWGVESMAELTAAHPHLHLLCEQSASECYGWAGLVWDALWRPWWGVPPYSMVTLAVQRRG